MGKRLLSAAGLALAALLIAAAATAKDFRPGDLRICNAKSCVEITDQDVLDAFASFYYRSPPPASVQAPRLRTPYFQLKYTNGYVTGIVATGRLDRFLSYGVNLGQFARGRWYRVPGQASLGLRELTAGLRPFRLSRAAVAKSR